MPTVTVHTSRALRLTNTEAGERFEEVVRVAIARSRTVHSMADLIRCTELHQNTIYDIFNGNLQEGPGPRTVNLIARCLDIPTRHLWDAWEGREPEPDTAEEALRRHADAVAEQNRLLSELVGFIHSAAVAVASPLDDDEEAEAQVRARRAQRAAAASEEPPVPPEKAGSGR